MNILNNAKIFFPWVISATEAKQIIEQGATILDVRNRLLYFFGHIAGAIPITWQQFSQQTSPDKGKLLDNSNILENKLRQVGIYQHKPVIVVGNPTAPLNFGEEGRIVWMLRTLGHPQTAFVDGGYQALIQAQVPIERGLSKSNPRGDFTIERSHLWEIERDQLQAQLSSENLIVIDTRTPAEYAGSTPYGEQRGGHIPGAVHFYFKDLVDEQGKLLSSEQIIAKLNKLGIKKNTAVVAYCTGGIRSAFVVAAIANLGFTNVKNYAGSMWEWSAAPADSYLLEK